MTCGQFAEKVSQLQAVSPFSVTSWWRTRSRNRDVGGHVDSLHLIGLAIDIVLDSETDRAHFLHFVKRVGLKYIEYDNSNHIHIQIP